MLQSTAVASEPNIMLPSLRGSRGPSNLCTSFIPLLYQPCSVTVKRGARWIKTSLKSCHGSLDQTCLLPAQQRESRCVSCRLEFSLRQVSSGVFHNSDYLAYSLGEQKQALHFPLPLLLRIFKQTSVFPPKSKRSDFAAFLEFVLPMLIACHAKCQQRNHCSHLKQGKILLKNTRIHPPIFLIFKTAFTLLSVI